MKKSLLNLGTVLSRDQQRSISGGVTVCNDSHCWQQDSAPSELNSIRLKDGSYYVG